MTFLIFNKLTLVVDACRYALLIICVPRSTRKLMVFKNVIFRNFPVFDLKNK